MDLGVLRLDLCSQVFSVRCDFQPGGGLSALLCGLVNTWLAMIAMGASGMRDVWEGGKEESEPQGERS